MKELETTRKILMKQLELLQKDLSCELSNNSNAMANISGELYKIQYLEEMEYKRSMEYALNLYHKWKLISFYVIFISSFVTVFSITCLLLTRI